MVGPICRLWIIAYHSAKGDPSVMIPHDIMHRYVQTADQTMEDVVGGFIITHRERTGFGFHLWLGVRGRHFAGDDHERWLWVQPVDRWDHPCQRLNRFDLAQAPAGA